MNKKQILNILLGSTSTVALLLIATNVIEILTRTFNIQIHIENFLITIINNPLTNMSKVSPILIFLAISLGGLSGFLKGEKKTN